MFLVKEQSNNFSVFYFRNSYPMELTLFEDNTMNLQSMNSFFEMKIFLGDENPDSALK